MVKLPFQHARTAQEQAGETVHPKPEVDPGLSIEGQMECAPRQ